MLSLLRQSLSLALLLAAASSLVIGPSPAAVQADYRHRMEEEKEALALADWAGRATDAIPDVPTRPGKDDESLASFVAPASAKPAQSQWSNTVVAVSGAGAVATTLLCDGTRRSEAHDTSLRDLHHPSYLAHAPPIA